MSKRAREVGGRAQDHSQREGSSGTSKRHRIQRRWSEKEEEEIIDYLRATIVAGKAIEVLAVP